MKKSPIILAATVSMISLFVSSYKGGTYEQIGNHTASAGTTESCGKLGCHVGATSTLVQVEVRRKKDGIEGR